MSTAVDKTDDIRPLAMGLGGALLAVTFVLAPVSVALVAALGVVWLSVTENETFLLLMIFLVPVVCLRQVGPITDVTTPLRLLVVMGFFAGRFWRGNLRIGRLAGPRLSKVCAVLLMVGPLSVLAGPIGWDHHSMSQNYELASWVGFFFFILAWVNSRKRLEKVLRTLLWTLCLVGVFAVVQVAAGGFTSLSLFLIPPGPNSLPWSGRAGSFLGYPNQLAGYLDMALPFAIAAAALARGSLKKLGTAAFALGVAAMVCSQSLGGLITLGFTLGLAVWFFVRSRRNKIALASGLILLGAGFFAVRHVLNPAHFTSSQTPMLVDAATRFIYFHAAWVLFQRNLLFGVGLGNFVVASPALVPNAAWMQIGHANLSASNLYLNLLAETGIVGIMAFLYLLWLALRKARAEARSEAWQLAPVFGFGALGAFCAVLVHGCVDYLFYTQYGTYFYMVLGLLMVSSAIGNLPGAGARPTGDSGGFRACA